MTNEFDYDADWTHSFWESYPRWRFHSHWKCHFGYKNFVPFLVWWNNKGSIGICILNFELEYNPYHKDK